MKMDIAYLPIAACIVVATTAFAMLCVRTFAQGGRDPAGVSILPIGFRLFRAPALLLVPWIALFLPAAKAQATLRLLDAAGLHPPLTPDLWFASRAVHGMVASALVLLLGGADSWLTSALAGGSGFMLGAIWLHRLNHQRELQITRELPAYLDLLTVCVEAGATLTAGVRLIVAQAPESPLRSYFDRVLREVRSGRPRAQAFSHVAGIYGVESLTTLANALAHAEGAGMSLGQILRTQSEQRTAERFARAERLAMQAPVKMLGPLIFCIFPCTFIVLAVPIVVRMMEVFRA
jgi:tight adherence protein C